jgi:secondary thiamine-phosphate synthase enzyme
LQYNERIKEKFSYKSNSMVRQIEFQLAGVKRGFHLITGEIIKNTGNLPEKGLLHILIKHTSAAIIINENADPDVRHDMETFLNKLVPESPTLYDHNLEGLDDMPAHIKSSLLGQSLTIPISGHSLNLGTWQGVYLCEFRDHGGPRSFILTIID